MKMTREKAIDHKILSRKVLACVCAAVLALLQCAVVLTIDTEEVHANTTVKVKATSSGEYGSVTTPEKEYSIVDTDVLIQREEPNPDDPDGEKVLKDVTLKGAKVSDVIKTAKLEGGVADLDENFVIVGKNVYRPNGEYYEDTGTTITFLTIDMGEYNPVEKIVLTPDEITVTQGKPKTISVKVKYKASIFNFTGSDAKFLKLKWSSSNTNVATVKAASNTLSATVSVKKKGNATITAFDNNSTTEAKAKVGAETTTKKTTTTTTTTKTTTTKKKGTKNTGSGKSITGATIKLTSNIYRNTTYSDRELQKKIKVIVDGRELSDDYWYVASHESKDNRMVVTIKGKGAYKGSQKVVSLSKSSSSSGSGSGNSYRSPIRNNTIGSGSMTRSTSSTLGTTATTMPSVTFAPGSTLTAKEVTIGQMVDSSQQDPYDGSYSDPYDDSWEEPMDEAELEEEMRLDFGPAAGSAAVAAAACGVGAVGRVRRFRLDTAVAAVQAAKSAVTGEGGEEGSSKIGDLLSKLRRK